MSFFKSSHIPHRKIDLKKNYKMLLKSRKTATTTENNSKIQIFLRTAKNIFFLNLQNVSKEHKENNNNNRKQLQDPNDYSMTSQFYLLLFIDTLLKKR